MVKSIPILAACAALSTLACGAASSAQAAIVFNLASHSGNLGKTETYTDIGSGLSITAAGFKSANHATDLFGKTNSGDESGLGLANDPSGDGEIYYGDGFVQLDLGGLKGKVDPNKVYFDTNSVTNGESWKVYGSNTSGSFSLSDLVASGSTEDTPQLLSDFSTYQYFDFISAGPAPTYYTRWNKKYYNTDGGNFLVKDVSVTEPGVLPEPAAWATMLIGMFGVGAALRSRRKAAQALA